MIIVNGLAGALVSGAVVGAAVALPLGAIGVLLVQEAISGGWWLAGAGALGVALVDLLYATVAVLAGATAGQLLTGRVVLVQLGGAGLLIAIAIGGLNRLREEGRRPLAPALASSVPLSPPAPPPSGRRSPRPAHALRVTGRFVALTAVNPLTAVYFVASAASLGSAVRGPARATAFLVGVFVASLIWQLVLVTAGALAGRRLGVRARLITGMIGYLMVAGYAATMIAGAAAA